MRTKTLLCAGSTQIPGYCCYHSYTLPLNPYHFEHKCRILGCENTVVALSTLHMNEDHITPDAWATMKNKNMKGFHNLNFGINAMCHVFFEKHYSWKNVFEIWWWIMITNMLEFYVPNVASIVYLHRQPNKLKNIFQK